ncbi:MAG: MaoC/PaaZ C-terminal domain-containing protein [Candidatus Micrarchaeia archaeon]
MNWGGYKTNSLKLEVGYEFETEGMTIPDAAIFIYAGLTGETHPAHEDDEYAKNSIFGKRVVQGLLTLSICQGFLSKNCDIRAKGKANLGMDNVRFLKPVFPGDTIRARAKIIDVRESKKHPENKIVKIQVKGVNQDNIEVISYETTLLF